DRARCAGRLRHRRLPDQERHDAGYQPVGSAPRSTLLRAAGDVRSRSLGQWPGQAPAALRLLPLWWRPADLHRRLIRHDGGGYHPGHDRAALSPDARARPGGGAACGHHAAAKGRHPHGGASALSPRSALPLGQARARWRCSSVRAGSRSSGGAASMAGEQRMNLLILMGDQHRYDALGCAADGIEPWERTWLMDGPGGRPIVRTPHLDRLAATGVRFHQAVANLPVCVPCRHSFITGLYPHQIGILTNAHYWPFEPPVPTLPMYLKPAGYASAAIGKMHWKNRNAPAEHVPDKRGFDYRVTRGGTTDGPCDLS